MQRIRIFKAEIASREEGGEGEEGESWTDVVVKHELRLLTLGSEASHKLMYAREGCLTEVKPAGT